MFHVIAQTTMCINYTVAMVLYTCRVTAVGARI